MTQSSSVDGDPEAGESNRYVCAGTPASRVSFSESHCIGIVFQIGVQER